jgi:hypothetical protein
MRLSGSIFGPINCIGQKALGDLELFGLVNSTELIFKPGSKTEGDLLDLEIALRRVSERC